MTGRKCGSCKHYEPAPIWRKGWCRNPLLYSPQQSHLVGEEDLDCERGMGNYWESGESSGQVPYIPLHPVSVGQRPAIDAEHADQPRGSILTTPGGQPIYVVSGSSGYPGDPDDDDLPPPTAERRPTDPRGRERQLDYYSEERYWTDYVRIGLPILGVILILLVALLWIIPFFTGDDDDDGTLGEGDGTATTSIPVLGPDATPTTQAGATGTPRITLTTPPNATTPAGAAPTATPAIVTPPEGGIAEGSTVVVANTGGTGVNMRTLPSVDGEIVTVVLDGTELVVTGPSEEADGFVWWPVQGEAGSGYIVEDYLAPAG